MRPSQPAFRVRRGYGLVGLLITFACMAVLAAILMNSLNSAVTGSGSQQGGTVRSLKDQLNLVAIMQGVAVYGNDHRGRLPVPSDIDGSDDRRLDTTANLYSAMIMARYVNPENLIAGNEYSGYVELCTNYDYHAYNPTDGVYWDPYFVADLNLLSNASYGHLPLYGQRFEDNWKQTYNTTFPLFGNRGPADGVVTPNTLCVGRNRTWGGHMGYGDGHVAFVSSPELPVLSVQRDDGTTGRDNVFTMESGPDGKDALIVFTKTMTGEGPTLQWD